MNWTEILIGQLPEALYFALFMIYAKNLRTKKLLFILITITEYFILKYIFQHNIWFQATYTFMTYAILKYLYKGKAQITDIFTFSIGSLIMIAVSVIVYFIFNSIYPNLVIAAIVCRILLFIILFTVNYRFYKIQNIYKKLWNRNDKVKKRIKSITFRCWNLVIFNLMFYLLSILIKYVN